MGKNIHTYQWHIALLQPCLNPNEKGVGNRCKNTISPVSISLVEQHKYGWQESEAGDGVTGISLIPRVGTPLGLSLNM